MIGLPTETDDDVAGIVAMGRQAFEIGRRYVRKVDVTVAISSHVPKPHTPFQWCAMDSIPELLRKQKIVFDGARKAGVWARKHDHRVSHLEGILARGDYRTGRLLELAWRNGARFDGWDEHLNWRAWSEALESWESETGLERTMMLGTLPVDAHLPWDHIDVGLEDGFLLKEYKKALVNRLSPPCGKPFKAKVHHTNVADAEADKRLLVCYHCGIACDLKKMREERIDFLDRLGAREPIAAEDRPHPRATAHERIKAGLKPHDFAQGEPQHVRLRYGKLGSMALQGHLDMITMLPRVARRAGIEVYFSEGFSPKPLTSAGPALGMGMRSISEYVDIAFAQPVPAGWLLQQLNAFAPDGLLFLEAAPLGPSKEGVSAFIDAARYVAALPSAAGTAESVERRIAELLASDPEVEAIRKDKSKRVRLSRALASARVTRAGELAPLLGVGESDPVVEVTQHIVENTLKPTEVYRVVCGVEVEPHAIVRVAMGRLVAGRIEAPTATDPRVRTGAATASIGEARAWHAERVRIVAPVVGANDQFEPADDGDEAALEFGAPVPEPQRPGMAALVPDAVPDLRALASLREAPGALAAGEA
jgi:radical SAM-linked protein